MYMCSHRSLSKTLKSTIRSILLHFLSKITITKTVCHLYNEKPLLNFLNYLLGHLSLIIYFMYNFQCIIEKIYIIIHIES